MYSAQQLPMVTHKPRSCNQTADHITVKIAAFPILSTSDSITGCPVTYRKQTTDRHEIAGLRTEDGTRSQPQTSTLEALNQSAGSVSPVTTPSVMFGNFRHGQSVVGVSTKPLGIPVECQFYCHDKTSSVGALL
ncbi:hypothetical protein BaRGS_00018359 [Batillaria attramentaria]|uniref:Uncharacterized protein n=1 Tax=Batillaria attramentaria TaxID=370345 RepID=A0ABD0KT79_9CAEN